LLRPISSGVGDATCHRHFQHSVVAAIGDVDAGAVDRHTGRVVEAVTSVIAAPPATGTFSTRLLPESVTIDAGAVDRHAGGVVEAGDQRRRCGDRRSERTTSHRKGVKQDRRRVLQSPIGGNGSKSVLSQCPVNVCFAFNSDQIADIARRQFGADSVEKLAG
jgi:hypothetical protein